MQLTKSLSFKMRFSLIDNEDWKDVWGFPGYRVSNYGRCASYWKGNKIIDFQKMIGGLRQYKAKNHNYRGYQHCAAMLKRKLYLEETYPISYYNKLPANPDRVTNSGFISVYMPMHKLVMWHFNPLEENPQQIGISKKEWESMPERARQIIMQCMEINHIDHNQENNAVWNLEYVTKVENIAAYHKQYRGTDKFKKNSV